jgi:hypothetical protein
MSAVRPSNITRAFRDDRRAWSQFCEGMNGQIDPTDPGPNSLVLFAVWLAQEGTWQPTTVATTRSSTRREGLGRCRRQRAHVPVGPPRGALAVDDLHRDRAESARAPPPSPTRPDPRPACRPRRSSPTSHRSGYARSCGPATSRSGDLQAVGRARDRARGRRQPHVYHYNYGGNGLVVARRRRRACPLLDDVFVDLDRHPSPSANPPTLTRPFDEQVLAAVALDDDVNPPSTTTFTAAAGRSLRDDRRPSLPARRQGRARRPGGPGPA